MQFGHEQLDFYRVPNPYLASGFEAAKRLRGIDSHAPDQVLRASPSIPLNIAEAQPPGNHLRQRSDEVRENPGRHDNLDYDYDNDNDNGNGARSFP